MIKIRKDLAYFINEDRNALGRSAFAPLIRYILYKDGEIFYFQKLLRTVEFLYNSKRNLIANIRFKFLYGRFKRLSIRYGFTIPLNAFGPGLSIAHRGFIVINPEAKIGSNCRIHPGTVIGEKDGQSPIIGNNVYIGPGAKIFGGITIVDNVRIGANAVVNNSILKAGVTVVGVPAKIISES